MEAPNQEKITGRLCAVGRAKFSPALIDEPGYVFTKNGFAWELDPIDQDRYGITLEALTDCVDQLEKMGTIEDLKGSEHIRQFQGWMNPGIAIVSKIDPRITCVVTLVDQEYEDADVNMRWYVDLEKESVSARGPAERGVDKEELKAVERAQEMSKEVKTESIDALFENPLKFLSEEKKTSALSEGTDGWGLPLMEAELKHVGVDALEKPHGKEGDKDREEVSGSGVKVKSDGEHMDGKSQGKVGGVDIEKELADAAVKPGGPEDKPKIVGEEELKHVGVDALEKPHGTEGDKDRKEVAGTSVDVKPADPEKKPEVMAGKGGEVGGTDKEADVAAAKVKPGTPEQDPKLMAEKVALQEKRKKQFEAYVANKKKAKQVEETKARLSVYKKPVSESVQHPVKAIETMKKHVEESHRALKKAHHLTEWAHEKVKEGAKHLPANMQEAINAHHPKIDDAKMKIHEAKKCIHEMCEELSKHHMGMKKK